MIYEETYNYLLRNVSSTEFDVCLYSLLKLDWDGIVRASAREIARKVGTTHKYVKQIINKFTYASKGRNVFVPIVGREGVLYKFNIGKSSMQFNNITDRYSKKYNFFYTETFRKLPINAKRLLLMGAFRMSILRTEEVTINIDEIVPSSQRDTGIPFTKKRLVEAICAIQESDMKNVVTVGIATNTLTEKEVVSFTFAPNTLNDYKENFTERELLRRKLVEAGYNKILPEDMSIEIEKVGKYLYNSLIAKEKQFVEKHGSIVGVKDEILIKARSIYDAAIKSFGQALLSKEGDFSEPKKASAYFSSIVHHVVAEEMAKCANQSANIDAMFEIVQAHSVNNGEDTYRYYGEPNDPIFQKKRYYSRMHAILQEWCEDWVTSRMKKIAEDVETVAASAEKKEEIIKKRGWVTEEDIIKSMKEIRNTAYEQINTIENKLKAMRNNVAITWKENSRFFDRMKETIRDSFSIQRRRVQEKSFLIVW